MRKTIENMLRGYTPSVAELVEILNCNSENTTYLFDVAHEVTKEYFSDWVYVRGIIEFSNYCRCQCAYCGLNRDNKKITRYRMDPDEIIQIAEEAYEAEYRTVVLQSGEDIWYTREKISYIIRGIKAIGDMAITLSVGERDYEDYVKWKQDGVDRFLLKHETSNERLYKKLHPHSELKRRLEILGQLKKLKYQVGSGFLIGLPGQNTEDIARDILLLKKLNVDMAGIGPFIPHEQTPLGKEKTGSTWMTLKALALSRILLKNSHLPATTALSTVDKIDSSMAFRAGANVIMKKLEPYKYRRLYEIYPKPLGEEKTILQEKEELNEYIAHMGKRANWSRGDSLKQ